MNWDFIGFTIEVLGKILVAFVAINVHYRFRKQHQLNDRVFRAMSREHILGMLGISLIIVGYFLQVPGKI